MAKKKKETVVEKTTEQPKVDEKVEKLKVKTKATMKKFNQNTDEPIKVDMSKPPLTEEPKEEVTEEVKNTVEEITEEVAPPQEDEKKVETDGVEEAPKESPAIEEVTNEKIEETQEQIEEAIEKAETTGTPVPENIQKLIDFMEETGGDLNDYVKLNQDYSKLDDQDLLFEHYRQTKPHLNT